VRERLLVTAFALACSLAVTGADADGEMKDDESLSERLGSLKSRSCSTEALRRLAGRGGWKEYDGNPVLEPGKKGTWDAFALGSMTVVKTSDVYCMYYEAWGTRDYRTLQIGRAVSPDGVHWVKDPANPVVPKGTGRDWDRDGTWDPFVICEDGTFKMWYGGGVGGHCDWGFAVSEDGREFTKKGQISHLGDVEDVHVVHDEANKRYYMYYWDRRHEPMGLFRATSSNETDFDFADAEGLKIEGERYPGMYKFTHVFVEKGAWFMCYGNFLRPHCPNGTVRFASSPDGLHWTSRNRNLLAGHDGEILGVDDGLYLMYYGPQNHFDAKDCDIRLAIYNGDLGGLAQKE
jgi:hypothetical protein